MGLRRRKKSMGEGGREKLIGEDDVGGEENGEGESMISVGERGCKFMTRSLRIDFRLF